MNVRLLTRLVAGMIASAVPLLGIAHANPDLDVNASMTIVSGNYATIRVSPAGNFNPPVMLDFGGIAYANIMELYNNGVANIAADASIDALVALDGSSVNFNGGTVNYQADAHNYAILFVNGGIINGGVGLSDNASAYLRGGKVQGDVTVPDSASATLTDGNVTGNVLISANGSFVLNGSDVNGKVTTTDATNAWIVSGKAGGGLYTLKDSTVSFFSIPNSFSATPAGTWSDGIIYDIAFKNAYGQPQSFVLYDDDTVNPGKNFADFDIAPADVPEPGAIAFGVLSCVCVLGLIARKRKEGKS